MQRDDMIIVSVDDHVVEPPNMFDAHLPAKYADIAPKLIRKDDGTDVWRFQTHRGPEHRPQRGGRPPKEEYGIDPTSFDEIRAGCFDVADRVMDMNANGTLGSLNFPSLPGLRRPPLRRRSRTRTPRRSSPRRTTTGTSTSGAGTRPSGSSRSRSR